jgi:hypothetical protein
VVIRTPTLAAVQIFGSGKVILLGLHGPGLAASVHGSGEVRAEGQVRRLRPQIEGSGILDPGALQIEVGEVEISGIVPAQVHPTRRLDADIAGSGEVDYLRDLAVGESISGSDHIVGQSS